MRVFHGVIVDLGTGTVEELRMRLEDGVELLAAGHRADLEDVVHDIAAALLGRSIVLGPALPESRVRNGTRVHCLGPAR